MNFSFFTLGGRRFWADVFIYKKWRIQQSVFSQHCRLLDPWDIRRASGSLNDCKHAFEKYAKIFQIPLPKEKAIIFIHGLVGNKNQFSKMAKAFESAGYESVCINYPSTRKNMEDITNQFDAVLNNLINTKEIFFITDGIGGLILQRVFASSASWKKRLNIRKIIQINSPNRGYKLWEKLSDNRFALFFFGPLLRNFNKKPSNLWKKVPESVDFAIIRTENRFFAFLESIFPTSWKFIFPQIGDSFLAGTKNLLSIKTWRTNPLNDVKTIRACRNFIEKNKLSF